nr:nucleotide-binding alpha-beta plait domain-containing protein [Tanacetum cinerariifolium]
MGSFRSKEDDLSKILTSIYVSNFPESFSAKDLFRSCKQYGHVVDSFIPTKTMKDGKRFGFVRFINVFNVERLVNNLCTIWVGRLKLRANVARFKRDYMKGSGKVEKNATDATPKNVANNVSGKSFVSVVQANRMKPFNETPPALVLEDDCLNTKDLTLSLMGRVKEMASLANLKKALCNEGFDVIKISYLGELWVLLEFETVKTKESFRDNVGVGSWFSIIKQAYAEFVSEGRLVWVELDGVPFKFWPGSTFKRITTKWGELLDVDDYGDLNIHSKRICILTKFCELIRESFKIVFRGKVYWVRASEVSGWSPEFSKEEEEDDTSVEDNINGRTNDHEVNNGFEESDAEEVPETLFQQPDDQKNLHPEDPFGIYPLLNKDNVKVAQKVIVEDHSLSHPPGFTSEGDLNDGNNDKDNSDSVNKKSESKRSGCPKYPVLPRTRGSILNLMEEVVKVGQTMGDSVSNSGGILCIWDPNSFRRSSFTRSYYFVIVRGVWLKSRIDLMIVVVYPPQEAKEKRMLWDYLVHVSNHWVGKLVMMGDFNEVRFKSDRFGSNFNAFDANIFNSFISDVGLAEVPLGGSTFTWCHKNASKMSKLNRFFVSKNLMSMCPNITAITVERFISNHCPILLREVRFDFGPTPFCFYRYWLDIDGFDKLVSDSWNMAPLNKKNDIRNFMEELRECDEAIDKVDYSNEVVHKRTEILNKIHQVSKFQALKIAQKAKIKWAIEGDENVKFFHGMLNKKCNQSNIRGILVNGTWVDDPVQVKREFFDHFQGRFDKPSANRACLDTPFPVSLSTDQKEDLERMISKEEVKRVVWDCGFDKSPGPDCFSFSFYRHFWPIIEKDVFEAVEYFFMYGDIPNGCNSNFIALIPKILDANMVKDFRPISLIGSLYKIIAKILANRLVGVLGDIVNEEEEAYSYFKVDFEKASMVVLRRNFNFLKVLNKVPSSILKSLESIRSRFFTGQDPKSSKTSWVKWNMVLTPKDKGGLMVSSLYALNRGLMIKWVWRFYSQKNSLWTKVIKAIYREDDNLNKVSSRGVRTCWSSIVQEVRALQGCGINVTDFIRLKLGNGDNTRFWIDNCSRMRHLFALFSCDMSSSSWDFHVPEVVEGLGIGVPDFEREKMWFGIIIFFKKIGRVATNGSVFKADEI